MILTFDIDNSVEGITVPQDKIRRAAQAACEKYAKGPVDLNIAIVDDAAISRVHGEYMDDDSPTDVMSFDLTDDFEDFASFQVIVNAQMAQREAEKRGHSFDAELCLYVLHGLLHNLGFDDQTQIDFEKMHNAEDEILSQIGIGKVYRS
ncbi:Endoribonuclease YbeY [Limihaloglobus sulfuriphilus]|uniref:Endoribonuclease YbeY n=1 Tax=Limihaloglobus sulfuriphilus TaxID=1851148 RepID=A0A1Q2MAS7_9BACT|nr:rRNA maturation RNase YbeY [Limihaloglobus sulfuriphilus]AQQ69774.1 Endoribonuclease YbeY [Limihaloglobus sulfuriphilus]